VCDAAECFDEALLTGLAQRLDALPRERRERGVLLVLHMMGSHGPAYHRRSPAATKVFAPECKSAALQDCDGPALVNAYDNSIAYTDRVLADAVSWLQAQRSYDPMLLYVSDHGESLGENNLYLHGMPYALAPREQRHVPMLLWLPDTAAPQRECLKAIRQMPLSHDHLFHSVLGWLGVASDKYLPALDLGAACRAR
jgi:lipid A ethanolaminephosphotransferase